MSSSDAEPEAGTRSPLNRSARSSHLGHLRLKGPTKAGFEVIFQSGFRVQGPLYRAIVKPGHGLIGIATSKKIGTRPKRNRERRRLQSALRLHHTLLKPNLDLVFIVSPAASSAAWNRIETEVRELLERIEQRWVEESASS